jgi:hypothetical protein
VITADYDRFVTALKTYAKIYSHKIDDEQLRTYWNSLHDRDINDVERRLLQHGRKGKFFPKPRDLRPIEADRERVESNPQHDAAVAALVLQNSRSWDRLIEGRSVIGKLLLCASLKATYEISDDGSGLYGEKLRWLLERIDGLLADADPRLVLGDVGVRRLVLECYGQGGLFRLERKASIPVPGSQNHLQEQPELM